MPLSADDGPMNDATTVVRTVHMEFGPIPIRYRVIIAAETEGDAAVIESRAREGIRRELARQYPDTAF